MKLSIVIPAHNEEGCIEETTVNLINEIKKQAIEFEILIIDDNSTDNTLNIIHTLSRQHKEIKPIKSSYPKGFGFAVRTGLENFNGDVVVLVMSDASDSPKDILTFFNKIQEGYDCAFGSRFIRGGRATGYPGMKLILNRIFNMMIRILFGLKYNDMTNAFKMYRRDAIEGLKPFISHHFNMTVELPLKAITRGYTYAVVPNSWQSRKIGQSKLRLKEMGSRYMFIVLYCLIEKWLSLGDYMKESKEKNFPCKTRHPLP